MRIKCFISLLIVLLVLGCASAFAETTTVLMYLCGSNLQSNCLKDIKEMCEAELSPSVRVLAQAGGVKEWNDERFPDGEVCRFEIVDQSVGPRTNIGAVSMSVPETFKAFLEWGIAEAPADRYILVFWDHGGGAYGGVCMDAVHDGGTRKLKTTEIHTVLTEVTQEHPAFHPEIIGFDACLMACYEVAAHLSDFADYMVASEEVEPGTGWDYTAWLTMLGQDPGIAAETLAKGIADSYMADCMRGNPAGYYTLSVVRLADVKQLTAQLETLAGKLNVSLEANGPAAFSRLRGKMYAFGTDAVSSSDCVDFAAFLDAVRSYDEQLAFEIRSTYLKAVRYTVCTDKFEYNSGLSIFWPNYYMNESTPEERGYSQDGVMPVYTDFVKGLMSLSRGGSYSFTAHALSQGTSAAPVATAVPMEITVFRPNADNVITGGAMTSENASQNVYETESDAVLTFCTTLPPEDMANLSSAESVIYAYMTTDGVDMLWEMGASLNTEINWETGEITAVFDYTLPYLGDNIVNLYDQINTPAVRRCAFPVKLNGQKGSLLVVATAASPEWRIVGFTEGNSENGMAARDLTTLKPGDVVIPLYNVKSWTGEAYTEDVECEGSPVTVDENGALPFEFRRITGTDDVTMAVAFRLHDIFNGSMTTEPLTIDFGEVNP